MPKRGQYPDLCGRVQGEVPSADGPRRAGWAFDHHHQTQQAVAILSAPQAPAAAFGFAKNDIEILGDYGSTDTDVIYKCTSPNTWTVFFTPDTYPHPLGGSSPPDTIAPAGPPILRCNKRATSVALACKPSN